MSTPQPSRFGYTKTVGLLGKALGIQLWDTASRRGLQDFVLSEDVTFYVKEVADAYLDRHDLERHDLLPPTHKVLEEALWYHNPTLDPEASESINRTNLACAVAMAGKEQRWWRGGRAQACDSPGRLSAAFYIALFAARLIDHVERGRAHHHLLSSPEMAWWPLRFHHKIAFAVALMYHRYYRMEWRPPGTFRKVRQASTRALCYLTSFRCPRCGQDYQDPKAGPLCPVCPLPVDGSGQQQQQQQQLEFERVRQQKLKAEVDDFFDSLGGPERFVIVKDERSPQMAAAVHGLVPPPSPGPGDPAWPVRPYGF